MLYEALLSNEVQLFIRAHEHEDERIFVLKNKSIGGIPVSLIADQIRGRKKSKEKLPTYYKTPWILFPPGINLEQCSSEATGQIKADFIRQNISLQSNSSCADLTGGFGVDTFYFSPLVHEAHYAEPDRALLEISKHNHRQLGANNIQYHNVTAQKFLDSASSVFDFIFIDPSRRVAGNKKVFKLSDAEPNVVGLLDLIFTKTSFLLLKASPLVDLQASLRELKFVKKILVVSVENDCKEVLFLCAKGYGDEPLIETLNITRKGLQHFSFSLPEERATAVLYTVPLQFLYEPNASILKAGAFKCIANNWKLFKLHPSTHLYTSDTLVENFPGKVYKIEQLIKSDPDSIKKWFPDGKANVSTRNYPLSVDSLKKKTGLKDGGEKYLIGFSSKEKKHLAVASIIK